MRPHRMGDFSRGADTWFQSLRRVFLSTAKILAVGLVASLLVASALAYSLVCFVLLDRSDLCKLVLSGPVRRFDIPLGQPARG